ncbi:MAG: alanine racemase domain protein [Candidatus Acidoferrum typicum]|nr:alanine racemase domain protein [Candidatus Acidoferrum typicum]
MSGEINTAAANLAWVRERMERAASRAGRKAEDITLIAVSKMHPAERIRELYKAGLRHFGENRVQEWELKRSTLADLDATWHLIGHLQSNKVARALQAFQTIDSVDSIALAKRIERAKKDFNTEATEHTEKDEKNVAREMGLRVLLEVRLDPAAAKSGVRDEELPRLVEAVLQLRHLDVRGLMGIPPYVEDTEKVRPFFRHLRELRDTLRSRFGSEILPVLSMGMSHDFEVAIEEGATEIRVGTALFGERNKV